MIQDSSFSNPSSTRSTSVQSASVSSTDGFHADRNEFNKQEADFEFLFARAIEFRQETIYFIVVDRFNDGDPSNSAGPNPELYDPTRQKWGKYWGGDLQGVTVFDIF